MISGVKLGVLSICALPFFGGVSVSDAGPNTVQTITFAQARACRVVGTFNVENQYSSDEDVERGALRKARERAIESGGDAILVQSTSVVPSQASGVPAVMTLKGQILVCRPDGATK